MGIKQRSKSLESRNNALADTKYQLSVLNNYSNGNAGIPAFASMLESSSRLPLQPTSLDILQINVGRLCNQSCGHCHVDAGPDRKEIMSKEIMDLCLEVLEKYQIPTLDITGGAPEMVPHFRYLVESAHRIGSKIMDRCNLTIIEANPKYGDLPEFFAQHGVHVISSLPYFSKSRTDSQRGDGVFEDSVKALKKLNAVGYGKEGSGLLLDLVYNPTGSFLPASQASLEREFKSQLKRKFNIEFNSLYCITNIPISRFLEYLIESNNYADYMQSLHQAFNPATVDGLMCRNTLSVDYKGFLYDCDFNQMLDLRVASSHQHIRDFDMDQLNQRNIVINQHCYGCTAGAGSSCGGEIA